MVLRLSYCPYHLEFKHPFGTAHGVRTGTDSIFIRLEGEGAIGHGEVTLPPYLKEKPAEVVRRLEHIGSLRPDSPDAWAAILEDEALFGPHGQGCRAGLQMALTDWIGIKNQLSVSELFDVPCLKSSCTLVTIGITPVEQLADKLAELPSSGGLKLKVLDESGVGIIQKVKGLDSRPLFLDANQGLNGTDEALALANAAGSRLLGIEQPFPVGEHAWQRALQDRLPVEVYGDESIQDMLQLEDSVRLFKGVNIKLMKCGGLDRAQAMAKRAGELGLKVMLGSMSESSLGCTAMAHLAGQADLIDLDGPWLIRNDPFRGMDLDHGRLKMPDRPGIGAVLVEDLPFQTA